MKNNKDYQLSSLISVLVFLSISSLLIRGSFYSALINGALIFVYLIYFIRVFKNTFFDGIVELLILSIPFFIVLLGCLLSDNPTKAVEFVFRSLPLISIPFLYTIVNPKATMKGYFYIEIFFPQLTLIVMFSYVLIGYFMSLKGLGDYLFYSNFSQILDIHPTYSGCIVNLALFFAIKHLDLISKYWHFLLLVMFLGIQIIIGSKASIFIALALSIYAIFKIENGIVKKLAFLFIPLVFLIVSKSFLESRLIDRKLGANENVSNLTAVKNVLSNDINARILLWKSSLIALEGTELFFGKGTASKNSDRMKAYQKNKLFYAVDNNYNAHNMFIEIIYYYGSIGLLFFLFHGFYLGKLIIDKKQWFYLILLLSFYFYFMFESFLMRSFGIILYAFVITYIYINLKYFEKKVY